MLLNKLFLIMLSLSLALHAAGDNGMRPQAPEGGWHQEVVTGEFQKEIDKLLPNETLRLVPGTYQGPIHIKTPGITIDGLGKAEISGAQKGSVIVISAPDVTIKGVRVTNSGLSYTQADSGIGLRSADNVKLINNKIENCLFGIDVYSGKNILIKENNISSKNLDIGLRGDAIRLWSVDHVDVINNSWQHSRDVVSWYSKNILFKGNDGSDSRYSLHSMYSQQLRIQDNIFKRNQVGIFLMYGENFIITNNKIERALGATGMGIGLKESSNIFAQNNTITYSAVGVMVDNSPFKMGSRNWFHGNKFAFNGKGVLLSKDLPGGEFKKNIFVGNLLDVDSEQRKGSESVWDSNRWDRYQGFDNDNNSIGDTPYVVRKYGDTIKGGNPKAAFFHGTPLFTLVEVIEEVTQFGEPLIIFVDKNPHLVN